MRSRLVLAVVTTVCALAIAGCNAVLAGFGDKDAEGCDCDTLAATVASIDWAGDGRELDRLHQNDWISTGPYPLVVSCTYDIVATADERDDLFDHILSTMAVIGISPVDQPSSRGRDRSAKYVGDTWALGVSTRRINQTVNINVSAPTPDEKTQEYLAPLIDAFGTR